MKYFDAHCHIQTDVYDADRDQIIESLRSEEIGGIVIGVDLQTSKDAIELVKDKENFYASVGLHPNDTPDEVFDTEEYIRLASHPKVVAIGECGLDYYRSDSIEEDRKRQTEIFKKQIEVAVSVNKPLMIHARPSKGTMDAYEDVVALLQEAKAEHGDIIRGNIHFFVGNTEIAEKLLALGFTFSFTAVLTFTSDYDEVIRSLPLSSILAETDSPYVAPAPNRGKRNDPRAVKAVIGAIVRIRGEDEETVRVALLANAKRVFGLNP